MQIVKILGGLGNQMFQYAFFLAIKQTCEQDECFVDLSCFRGYSLHNGFELPRIFRIDAPAASFCQTAQVAYPYSHYRLWQIGKRLLPKRKSMVVEPITMPILPISTFLQHSCYFDGYWQHDDYFRNISQEVKKAYSFPSFGYGRNEELARQLLQKESVSIHIRRGDYLQHKFYRGICDLDYYSRAISAIRQQTSASLFCIFSNDVEWCKQHIAPLIEGSEAVYVDWNKGSDSYRDIQLMAHCRHHIVANSSFSWWGAWLSLQSDGITIAPKQWLNIPEYNSPACSEWLKI